MKYMIDWLIEAPPAKISYTTPHYDSKYEIWTIGDKIVNNPFKDNSKPNLYKDPNKNDPKLE